MSKRAPQPKHVRTFDDAIAFLEYLLSIDVANVQAKASIALAEYEDESVRELVRLNRLHETETRAARARKLARTIEVLNECHRAGRLPAPTKETPR
jgi:hypothetical protein